MTKKLTDCKFDISENSPEWHSRYNEIIEYYAHSRERDSDTSISPLSDDECIILAMTLSKLSPGENPVPDWSKIRERADGARIVAIPEPDKVTFRVILPVSPITYEEASLFLRASPYSWADAEHLSFITLAISNDAIVKKHDIGFYEAKAKDIFYDKCLRVFHEMERENSSCLSSINKIYMHLRHSLFKAKILLKKHWY